MVENIKREYNESEEPVAPLTPESTPSKNSDKSLGTEASSEDLSPSSPPPKKRVKQNKNSSSKSKAVSSHGKRSTLPSCYEEASETDRLLLKLKDENKTWKEICAAMEKLTGEKAVASSLRPRHWRLKANITVMPKEDQDQLLSSKAFVDMRFEKEKWNMVAEEMKKNGSGSYTGAAVEKQFKKMKKSDHPVVKRADLDEDSE